MITFPLNYVENVAHNGQKIIKPSRPALLGWQKLTQSEPIYEDQGIAVLTGRLNNITTD